jgi:aminodeoxyfutalosine synthase
MKTISTKSLEVLISTQDTPTELKKIYRKIIEGIRISEAEGLMLFEKAELSILGSLANYIRESKHGNNTFFNRNIHIEPTNICVNNCKFCSYRRRIGEEGAWELTIDEMVQMAQKAKATNVTEIHIVGGVHPNRDIEYYGGLIKKIKEIYPSVHIKAFTAVELEHMINQSGLSLEDGMRKLKEYGLGSLPGGGAEIFAPEVRRKICDDKATAEQWLAVHETAHKLGIPSNATILYGHIENYAHRIDHLARLRNLQDKTHGFNTFIPLKFKNKNNPMSGINEVSVTEDLRNYAVSRIFLDNFEHIKAYWVMIGREIAQASLAFGVDDLDGTIDDSTKIYSMAGAEDQTPSMSTEQLASLIKEAKRTPVERDTLYNVVKIH